jgi:acetylglutamate kinase
LIEEICLDELDELVNKGILCGGMLPKADCCKIALEGGVSRVRIVDGRIPHILKACLIQGVKTGTHCVGAYPYGVV